MTKPTNLPYRVDAFGATIATFNSLGDAERFALATSGVHTAGWITVHGADDGFGYVAFQSGVEVKRGWAP